MLPIIEVKNLSKSYQKKEVLKNLNVQIYPGDRVAILGANGCGKTTFVEMISNFLKPTAGEIIINLDSNIKKDVGIQFQEGYWPIGIRIKDMIKFYRKVYENFSPAYEKMLEEVFELDKIKNTNLQKLSGGQKQRFNAMLAVINNPKIVILDELTTGLDIELQYKILNFFNEYTINNNKTLLIVSHHPEEVEMLCNRILLFGNKSILLDCPIKEVKNKFGSIRNLMNLYFKGEIKHENYSK
ncbi:ABC-2 type transport system ATP-binding protein [Spiroplasma syrphidicola EA-1]|uniref:ABC-2 type transport system ATP-binding protein n=1 Tax=Spiroplasma syrphidicola EA-1 TaxID=1276229 RepID=R4U3T3_9MOLU|nr:ABC transporter ATP-binding protein [Spiroplasma syrphidicola]AGM26087.1 ABC-2 type transport system ATP-binding protein [Spiroplasma syrphidicola EA-1]